MKKYARPLCYTFFKQKLNESFTYLEDPFRDLALSVAPTLRVGTFYRKLSTESNIFYETLPLDSKMEMSRTQTTHFFSERKVDLK
jgi:hypothetical protein